MSEAIAAGRATPARIVGIGASAGGVDALTKVVSALPADLPHAICIVLHLAPAGRSLLAAILARHTTLPVATAQGGEQLRPGQIFVAPPDRHLLVRDGHLVLTRGPKENCVRPAVDTMLRSLATASGPAAVAVILSGALGDGANGALAVRRAGGTVIVQDPADALVPSMPERALAAIGEADSVLPATGIAHALAALDGGGPEIGEDGVVAAPEDMLEASRQRPQGPASGFTCPECNGAICSELLHRIADRRTGGHPSTVARLLAGADVARARANLIRRALATGDDSPGAFDLRDADAAGSAA